MRFNGSSPWPAGPDDATSPPRCFHAAVQRAGLGAWDIPSFPHRFGTPGFPFPIPPYHHTVAVRVLICYDGGWRSPSFATTRLAAVVLWPISPSVL